MLALTTIGLTSYIELLNPLFSPSPFIPHGHCYLWKPGLVGLHLLSDALTALAYYSIPLNLLSFVRQRKDLPFNWVFILFGAFIIACGTTHLLEIWTLWHPIYWVSGVVKAVTAITSLATAIVLAPLVPKAVALPSRTLLEATNRELEREVGERRKSEARYRAIVEDQTEFIARLQADGTLLFVNDAYCRYFGVDQQDLIGKKYEPVVYAADREKVVQVVASLSAENPVVTIENRVVVAGEVRWTQWRNRWLSDETGEFLEIQAVGRDITELKQTEEQLRNFSDRLTLALKSGAIGTWEWDFVHEAHWDDGMYEIYGFQHLGRDAVYQDWVNVLHPDDRINVESALQSVVRGDKDFDVEFHITRPDSALRVIKASAIVQRNEQGEPQRMVGINYDITARKQAEEQLQQTNQQLELLNTELARATRLKDEFLANMSHELRTPLTSILGMSDVLQEEIYGELNQKQHQYLGIINQSGRHLLSLINDILDLAKIESGTLELESQVVFVEELCSSSLSFVKQLAYRKKIKLFTLIDSSIYQISVDELRIRQALINLLNNAVKFTPEEGQVTLEVKRDPVHNCIQFSITDTGIGIATEDMPKLFQSFVQIDSSLSRQYNGTGLGLALVKKIVELHQGSVVVDSTLGQGSCFTITLPNCSVANNKQAPLNSTDDLQPEQANSNVTQPQAPQFLVLLADDNAANIATFSDYLMHYGCQLLIAADGEESVALAKEHQPDVILMDIQMPKLDGLAAMRQIRSISELANIPIIALTALAMPDDRERCLAAGANEYLTKPVRLKHLIETIKKLCEQKEKV